MELHSKGYTSKQIAEQVGYHYLSVRRAIRNEIARKTPRKDLNAIYEQMAIDRVTMTIHQVSEKYGYGLRHIRTVTRDHPLSDKFLRPKRGFPEKQDKKPKSIRIRKSTKPTKEDSMKVIQKGHFKLQKNENVFETKVRTEARSVPMYDSKNTVLFIKSSDKRTNEQIRKEWLEKREGELRRVAS